jgi:hypothetical protein
MRVLLARRASTRCRGAPHLKERAHHRPFGEPDRADGDSGQDPGRRLTENLMLYAGDQSFLFFFCDGREFPQFPSASRRARPRSQGSLPLRASQSQSAGPGRRRLPRISCRPVRAQAKHRPSTSSRTAPSEPSARFTIGRCDRCGPNSRPSPQTLRHRQAVNCSSLNDTGCST